MTSAPRVILSAYQCGPGLGSVSQIGWEWYSRLSRRLPVTLVTHVRNRRALTAAGAPLAGSQVVWIDTEWFAGPLYRLASGLFGNSEHAVFLMSSLDFFVYDHVARRTLARRIRAGERWDLVHAVTPVSPVAASGLGKLGMPVILGPLNGGLRSPPAFPELMRQDSAWLYPLRNLGKLADLWKGSTRRAALILAATKFTVEGIPERHRSRCVSMMENGVDLQHFRPQPWPDAPSASGPLRILFVGRLVPFKALGLLLHAIAQVKREFPLRLRVVGDGPLRSEWEQLSAQLGLDAEVRFLGALPLAGVAGEMERSHVFCLPSVRESGGAVLLEAMASARPVIAVAYGGPAELIDDQVGRGVSPDGPQSVVTGLAEAFRDIVRHPDQWRQRGACGRRRAEERYGWDAKVAQAVELYTRVLAGGAV